MPFMCGEYGLALFAYCSMIRQRPLHSDNYLNDLPGHLCNDRFELMCATLLIPIEEITLFQYQKKEEIYRYK